MPVLPPDAGYPAPEDSVLARKALLAQEAFARSLDIGWLGPLPPGNGEPMPFSPSLSQPTAPGKV